MVSSGLPLLFNITYAQSSLKCYSPDLYVRRWIVGLRTGVSREINNSNFSWDHIDSKTRNWSQQIFVQRELTEHWILEFQVAHQKSWNDIPTSKLNSGRLYTMAINKFRRLHNNLILNYGADIGRIGGSVGTGDWFFNKYRAGRTIV